MAKFHEICQRTYKENVEFIVLSVFIWRHHFPKLKITIAFEVVVSSDVKLSNNLTFYMVYVRQGSLLCHRRRQENMNVFQV